MFQNEFLFANVFNTIQVQPFDQFSYLGFCSSNCHNCAICGFLCYTIYFRYMYLFHRKLNKETSINIFLSRLKLRSLGNHTYRFFLTHTKLYIHRFLVLTLDKAQRHLRLLINIPYHRPNQGQDSTVIGGKDRLRENNLSRMSLLFVTLT